MFVKPQLVTSSLIVFCMLGIKSEETANDSCFCGYGGVCRFRDGKALKWNCSDCETISGGLYKDCSSLLNHCESNPCMNSGACFMTFGSFYCKCPHEFFGHTCSYRRTEEEMELEAVVGPRTWFQVNRIGREITQFVYFTFESPGDNIHIHIRYDDGRFIEVSPTQFKLINAKRECVQDVNQNPQERDIRVCETLPDKNVFSIELSPRYFDSYDDEVLPMEKVILSINGKNVTEGRMNEMHIAVINMNRVTFSQVYKIHTSFELKPKCKFRISFVGCSKRKQSSILHDKEKPIHLQAIREPIDDCSVGVVTETTWELPGKPPIVSLAQTYSLEIHGSEMEPGKNFIDFLQIVRGNPPLFGGNESSYNYARCWFKVVLGNFRVGVKGGKSRMVPCVTPLTMTLESLNPNFNENEFASMWRCEPESLENCKLRRFLGSKIFFRNLPCGVTVKFRSMIVHLPTGNKYYLITEVHTSIHVDTLNCLCIYNCKNNVDPRSKTRLSVEDVRLSTDSAVREIEWTAKLSGKEFDIAKFVTSGTMGKEVEIDAGTFKDVGVTNVKPVLEVIAKRKSLFCTMELVIDTPPPYPVVQMINKTFKRDVEDIRFQILIENDAFSRLTEPLTFEAREILGPRLHESVASVQAKYREIRRLKMNYPTYVIAKNKNGLESGSLNLILPRAKLRKLSSMRLNKRIRVIVKLFDQGNYNVVVTEIMYCTREIMVQKRRFLRQKIALLQILKKVISPTLVSSTSTILSELTKILQVVNRINLTPELKRPPFNIDIFPYVLPQRLKSPEDIVKWSTICDLVASIVLKVSKHFYAVSSEDDTTRLSNVLGLQFHALIRASLLRREYYKKHLDLNPRWKLQYERDTILQRERFDQSVYYLQKAIDHHVPGYTGEVELDAGPITVYGVVLPVHSVSQVAQNWFNKIQQVRIRINITDETISSYTSIFFSIFVEIPSNYEITTRVHICLVSHLRQNKVNATFDTQMQLNSPGGKRFSTTAHVQSSEIGRNGQKHVTMFKIETIPGLHSHVNRQISFHIESEDEVKLQVNRELPHYDQVYTSPAGGKGSFNVSTVANQTIQFLGFIPGPDVPSGLPRRVDFSMESAVCAVRQPIVIVGLDYAKECSVMLNFHQITQSQKFEPATQITCVCPEDGIVSTYRAEAEISRVLPDSGDRNDKVGDGVNRGLLWIIPAALIIIFVISWKKDVGNVKKEYIQPLEDTFPGDIHPYIVGVYTGNRLFSSTRAKVAMRIFGVSASSRVHILQTRSFKALDRGQDDWFIVYTNEHLGKLTLITLWHNFEKMWPAWYSSQIVIYDVEQNMWYRFSLHRWIGSLSDGIDDARIVTVNGTKFHPEIENMISFSFWRHYWRVLRNIHPLISLFFKHRRHIHSFKIRTGTFVILTLPMSAVAVYFDDVIGRSIPDTYNRIISIANYAVLLCSTFTFLWAYLISMSMMKTRKTRKLDLRQVDEFKAAVRQQNRHNKNEKIFTEDELKQTSSEELIRRFTSRQLLDKKNPYKYIDLEKQSVVQSHYEENPVEEKYLPTAPIENEGTKRRKRKRSTMRRKKPEDTPRRLMYQSVKSTAMKPPTQSRADKTWTAFDSNWSGQRQFTQLFKWIPDAVFRPIRFNSERSYIRYGGRGFLIAGWTVVITLTVAATIYLAYHTVVHGYLSEHIFSIIATAMALEWFFYAPLLYFLMSILTVFYAKMGLRPFNGSIEEGQAFMWLFTMVTMFFYCSQWGNFECNILELGGLPKNEKKILHKSFIYEITQPWYHPQTTEKLEVLHKKYWDRSNFMLYVFFLLVFSCFLLPWILILYESDVESIWRLKNSTENAYEEPTRTDYLGPPQMLHTLHDSAGLRRYMLSVYLPATKTEFWYNNKPLKLAKSYGWFIDRNSKQDGATIIRALSASNNSPVKRLVPPLFRQYFRDSHHNYDTNTYQCHNLHEAQTSWLTWEKIMNRGIYGKLGLFYPQCVWEDIRLSRRAGHNTAETVEIVQNKVTRSTRALLLDLSLIQPSFSSRAVKPTHSFTRIQILFEYAAAGPLSASVHVVYWRSRKAIKEYIS